MSKRSMVFAIICILVTAVCHADPRFASLKVTSEPDSATVRLDGKILGTTPFEAQVIEAGKHLLVVTKDGYRRWSNELIFVAGKRQVGNIKLTALTQTEIDSIRQADSIRLSKLQRAEGEIPDKNAYVAFDKAPEPIRMPQPVYPNKSKKYGIGGKVYIQMLVDTDGKVIKADIAKSSGVRELDDAAAEAAMKWLFSPAISPENKPVRVWVMQAFTFRIN